MVIKTLDKLLDYYDRHLDGLIDEDMYDTEAMLVLIARDELEDRQAELTAMQRKYLEALDERMAKLHEQVASVLPSQHFHDRKRWWWHLHEGPQVREQAGAYPQTK